MAVDTDDLKRACVYIIISTRYAAGPISLQTPFVHDAGRLVGSICVCVCPRERDIVHSNRVTPVPRPPQPRRAGIPGNDRGGAYKNPIAKIIHTLNVLRLAFFRLRTSKHIRLLISAYLKMYIYNTMFSTITRRLSRGIFYRFVPVFHTPAHHNPLLLFPSVHSGSSPRYLFERYS